MNGDRDTRAALVKAFLEAAGTHFAEEEEYLRRAGYSDVAQHEAHHAVLLAKAAALEELCEDGLRGREAEKYYGDLLAFVIDEVVRADHKFKSYLDHKGLTDTK